MEIVGQARIHCRTNGSVRVPTRECLPIFDLDIRRRHQRLQRDLIAMFGLGMPRSDDEGH